MKAQEFMSPRELAVSWLMNFGMDEVGPHAIAQWRHTVATSESPYPWTTISLSGYLTPTELPLKAYTWRLNEMGLAAIKEPCQ